MKKKTNELKPYKNNARTHSEKQVKLIADSIDRYGFNNPILINKENMVIAGHGRLEAAKLLELDEVPVVILDHLTKKKQKEYILADNRIAELAGWDMDLLSEELSGLDIDLGDIGFDNTFITKAHVKGLVDEDEVPELREETKVKTGDIWKLGNHRLMCGDSTDSEQVSKLMDGELADMVLTDPPYNTGMEADTKASWLSHMFSDNFTPEQWKEFLGKSSEMLGKVIQAEGFIYVFFDWRRSYELIPEMKKHYKYSNCIVWDKVVHGLGSDYQYTHEFIHVFKKGNPKVINKKDKEYQDIWRVQRKIGRDKDHATKKPIELLEIAIRHASKNSVCDLFGGSGSTLIAAERLNRKCYMMELEPIYCDVIITRWEKYTGNKAEKVNG